MTLSSAESREPNTADKLRQYLRAVACCALILCPLIVAVTSFCVAAKPGFRLTHADAVVLPGELQATVAIRLPQAIDRPVRFKYLTQSGTAVEGVDFAKRRGELLFLPGETEKRVKIPLLRELGTKRFKLVVDWPRFHPPFPGTTATISAGLRRPAEVLAKQPIFSPGKRRHGRKLVFQTKFLEPVRTDNRAGEWRSAFKWGRVQSLAPYADAQLHGTHPHPMKNGRRHLQLERRRVVEKGVQYGYSTAMMNTRGMVPGWQYGYFEVRIRIPRAQGTTPAFWLLPDDDYRWPPEIDVFEIFQNKAVGDAPEFTSSVHWVDKASGKQMVDAISLPFARPFDWHVIGFDWSREWMITYIDGVEVVRRPNRFHEPMYALFSATIGSLTEPPDENVRFPVSIELDYFQVWQ